jgi:enoyl-CoA hydratase/carnithine racemase
MSESVNAEESVTFSQPLAHVGLVTINRPAARNAIDGAVTQRLESLVSQLESDPDIWVVVLTGAGEKAFCAGADLREIAAGRERAIWTRAGGFAGFVKATRHKPWIAAVNGAALAGGMELALACDMIVASADAQFGLPEARRGLAAIAGGLFRLVRTLPPKIAVELIATGRSMTADEAARWGLVNYVVERGQTVERALQLAAEVTTSAPLAVRSSLRVARQAFDLAEDELFRLGMELAKELAITEDFKEGPRAFIEKRAPRWTGR